MKGQLNVRHVMVANVSQALSLKNVKVVMEQVSRL